MVEEGVDASRSAESFPRDGGEIGALIAAFDWSRTPLGAISGWGPALRTAVAMILRSPTAMAMIWGEEGILLYNKGYSIIAGGRHPAIMGGRAVDAFPELADFNRDVIAAGLAGRVLSFRDQRLTLSRHGAPEDVWLDLDYSPIPGETGRPAGVLAVVVETTERHLADERLRIAQQAGGFGAFEWYPTERRVMASDAYRRIFGIDPGAEVTDEMLLALVEPADRHRTGNGRLGRADNPLAYAEYRIRHGLSGETRWIARRGEILPGGPGVTERYLGVAWDITDLKIAQIQDALVADLGERLRDTSDPTDIVRISTEMLGRHLGAGRVGFGEIDEACEQVSVLAEWTDGTMPTLAGHHPMGAFGRPVVDGLLRGETVRIADIHDDARVDAALAQAYERVGMAAGIAAPVFREGRFVAAIYAVVGRARRWEDRDDAVLEAVATRTWEALQRALAEQRLRDSEENFRLLAQAMPVQAWVSNAEGRNLWVNEQAYAYTGAPPGALLREDWGRIVHPDDEAASLAAWTASMKTGETYVTEYRLLRHDGAYRWHIARALPLRDAQGKVARWIGASTDIDDQRRALADLAQLNATLEERVESRTRELQAAEEALRQSQKMEAIGQLTGGIAHDFNNLLTGILGSLELMRLRIDAGRTGELDRFMDVATASAQSAAALTQRLLAFARRQTLDNRPVCVGALMRGMEDLLRRTLGEQVRLRIDAPPDGWAAMTDPNQLESAILNLAINARDAMPRGGDLLISTENLALSAAAGEGGDGPVAGDYVAITVTDTGVGMTPEILAKAVEPFFTTKPVGQGTGLGLSMVFGFARQSGGDVRIVSAPGAGSAVTLLLPRAARAESAPVETPPAATPNAGPGGSGETVLVVEDIAAVRLLIVDVLRELGYLTLEAADADEALPILESGRPISLLVSDVGLPGMNGRQLADHARARRPSLKVLFVTGYADKAATGGGLLADGMAMIAKPFSVEALASKIKAMILDG